MLFGRANAEKKRYAESVRAAVQELKQGKEKYLHIVYQALMSDDKELVKCAAQGISGYMKRLTTTQIIKLDERFRQYTSMEWNVSWCDVDISIWEKYIENRDVYLDVVRLGTFHPNGYFRERCILEIAKDYESVGYILLRLNDWVSQIRKVAESACGIIAKLNTHELLNCLPYLEKVKKGKRKDDAVLEELEHCIAVRIKNLLPEINSRDLRRYDYRVRRYFYGLTVTNRYLSKEQINDMLKQEKNGECQRLIITLLFKYYQLDVKELDEYLVHKSTIVQRNALEQKYNIMKNYWVGLEDMLLSSSAGVRSDVCYILKKHTQIDILAYYKEHMDMAHKRVSILGIGENGDEKDGEYVKQYLADTDVCVVKNALHAIGMLMGEKAEDIFWEYLKHEHFVIMCAAYREIVKRDIHYGAKNIYELLVMTESPLLRKKLACRMIRERYWERLPYILRLYCCEDAEVQDIIRRGLKGRNMYATITANQAECIRRILNDKTYCIPESLSKEIEFDLKYVTKT